MTDDRVPILPVTIFCVGLNKKTMRAYESLRNPDARRYMKRKAEEGYRACLVRMCYDEGESRLLLTLRHMSEGIHIVSPMYQEYDSSDGSLVYSDGCSRGMVRKAVF